jgi:hypothetical protein
MIQLTNIISESSLVFSYHNIHSFIYFLIGTSFVISLFLTNEDYSEKLNKNFLDYSFHLFY